MSQTSENSPYSLDNGASALIFYNCQPGGQSDSAEKFRSRMSRKYQLDIKLYKNFTKQKLKEKVEKTAGREDCSGLFVFIFSCATGGWIVDMEGKTILFSEIKEMMSPANMTKKPKALCVELADSDSGRTGGLSNGFEPKDPHFFFFVTTSGDNRDFLKDLTESARGDLVIETWLTVAVGKSAQLIKKSTLHRKLILKDVLPEGEDASELLPTNSSKIGDILVDVLPEGEDASELLPTNSSDVHLCKAVLKSSLGKAMCHDRKMQKKFSDRLITFDGCNLPLNMPAFTIADCGFVASKNEDKRDEFKCLACELTLSDLPENECDLVDIHNDWSGGDCEWLRNSNCWQMRRELLQRLQFLLL